MGRAPTMLILLYTDDLSDQVFPALQLLCGDFTIALQCTRITPRFLHHDIPSAISPSPLLCIQLELESYKSR